MTIYSGDDFYDDDVTSGPIDDDHDYDPWNDIDQGRYDDDPNPYFGTYSED
jgi:hypothetical protein